MSDLVTTLYRHLAVNVQQLWTTPSLGDKTYFWTAWRRLDFLVSAV